MMGMMMMIIMPFKSSLALKNETTTATSSSAGSSAATTTTSSRGSIFTQQEHASFRRDGYVVVRDARLLNRQQVDNLVRAGVEKLRAAPKFPFYYAVSTNGAIFEEEVASSSSSSSSASTFRPAAAAAVMDDENDDDDFYAVQKAFRDAALFSNIPRAVAELMQLDAHSQTLRVLRDIFIAKSVHDDSACDWHVDDVGFWPQSYLSDDDDSDNRDDNSKDQNGINVWIALDDMPAAFQGGMALAPGSHTASWRHEAYLALGQNRSQDGGVTKQQVQQKMQERRRLQQNANNSTESNSGNSKYPTCELGHLNPTLQQTIDAAAVVLDIKRGDVIFSTRNLFHKTVAVTAPHGVEYYENQVPRVEFLKRYSIRYVPGSARLPNGWSVEWSVVHNASNAGRRLDDIVVDDDEQAADENNGNKELMFYPRVWPRPQDNMQMRLAKMAAAVENLKAHAQAEFMSTLFATTQ
jgi:Phytanoyl-CoA dioxygenase (PhyH)